jgi:hypothetical protein
MKNNVCIVRNYKINKKSAGHGTNIIIMIVGEPKEAARVYNTLTASTTLSQP